MPVYPLGYPIISGKQDAGTTVTNVLSSTPVDPLAVFNWAARLQTHIPGSNTPLGLYQDVACTIPCTMDGDLVAAWRDELSTSGFLATQSDTQKQGILVFDGTTPTLLMDGVDDNYTISLVFTADFFVGAGCNQTGDNVILGATIILPQFRIGESGSNVLATYDGTNNPTSTTLAIPQGSWSFLEFARSSTTVSFYQNGTGFGNGTFVGSLTSDRLGILTTLLPFNGFTTSLLVLMSDPSGSDRAIIENYAESLNP